MTTPVGIPNYQQLNKTLVGAETIRGTLATMVNKWYGMMALVRHQPLADSNDYAGTFFGDYVPTRGAIVVDGTWMQKLAYEDPHVFRYCIKGGVTGTDDGATVHGYTYDFTHNPTADDRDTFSAEDGDPAMIFQSTALMFPEFTISADIDDAEAVWKFSSKVLGITHDLKAGLDDIAATSGSTTTFVKSAWGLVVNAWTGAWVHFKTGSAGNIGLFRQVISNTATTLTFAALPVVVAAADTIDVYPVFTTGISDRTRELIKGPGTVLTLDTAGGSIGTTQITGRFLSFSLTAALNVSYKRFMENVTNLSNKQDLGKIKVTGQVRLEMDRKREWDKYKALAPELLRIRQTGTTIDSGTSTTKSINIDVYDAVWGDPSFDLRGSNKTATWPFTGFVDATLGIPLKISVKNTQATILS